MVGFELGGWLEGVLAVQQLPLMMLLVMMLVVVMMRKMMMRVLGG